MAGDNVQDRVPDQAQATAALQAQMALAAQPVQIAQAITIKPPVFSETSPASWFRILEAQFHIRNITVSATKFFHALSALPTEVLDSVSTATFEGENYENLKVQILSFYEKTKPELFHKLISGTAMTGRPSAYLRELQQVARKVNAGDDLVRHKFVQNLPPTIAPTVAALKNLDLDQLGTMADELMPLHDQLDKVNHVHKNSNARAEKKYSRNDSSPHSSSANGNSSFHSIPLGIRPFHHDQKPKFCRSHLYYAEKARNCKPWCRYPKKQGCSMEPSSRPSSPARENKDLNQNGGLP